MPDCKKQANQKEYRARNSSQTDTDRCNKQPTKQKARQQHRDSAKGVLGGLGKGGRQ